MWTAGRRQGTVYRVSRSGDLQGGIPTGAGAQAVSFADGRLWVGNQHAGSISSITADTGKVSALPTGQTVVGVVAGGGRLVVGLVPMVDPFAGLEGKVLRIAIDGDPLAVFDPPLIETFEMFQISNATCAGLLSFKDEGTPGGWTLQPELAASMPDVSDGGKTYTFHIREGVMFAPSGGPITAAVLKTSLERAMSTGFGTQYSFPNDLLKDLVGATDLTGGRAQTIDGIVADGQTLTLRFKQPADDYLTKLTLPFFCPVPPDVRAIPGGVNPSTGLPSAGPYYLASKLRDSAILKRDPTYSGPRKPVFDAIAITLNQDVRTSIGQVDAGQLDYVLTYADDALAPDSDLARTYGPGTADRRYVNDPTGDVTVLAIPGAFQARSPGPSLASPSAGSPTPSEPPGIVTDKTVRQAIASALDRPRLAADLGEIPAGRLFTPRTLGYVDTPLLPVDGPDLERATSLMAGRTGAVTLGYPDDCQSCPDVATEIAADLARIGLTVTSVAEANIYSADEDMLLLGAGYPDIDPVRFVDSLPTADLMRLSAEDAAMVAELGFLTGEARTKAAAALADRWAAETATIIPVSYGVSREYFSDRIGCRVFPPSIFAVDLVTLCPKD